MTTTPEQKEPRTFRITSLEMVLCMALPCVFDALEVMVSIPGHTVTAAHTTWGGVGWSGEKRAFRSCAPLSTPSEEGDGVGW
ncbi:hypothetical protein GCM10009676_39260 [Prauserella halophila]|uniref:Uncharacterized protein n=1 Tax=Prauserella halophila TaxID=185641 RepID=A0ABN1WFM0_9PSEU